MSVIYLLLAISLLVALVFFVAFVISVNKGQYDDPYTPSVRVLFEDEIQSARSATSHKTNPSETIPSTK